jgi:hypothetical protein
MRRFSIALGMAVCAAMGCGDGSSRAPVQASVGDPVDAVETAPEVAAPTPTPEPTATPVVVVERWETATALYLSPPADGVLRPVAELACRAEGFCAQIVLIGCTGTSVRRGVTVESENVCHSLPGSYATIPDFVVRTEGILDPETNRMSMRGAAEVTDGYVYDYAVEVQVAPDGASSSGTGLSGPGWPVVITGSRIE